MEVVVMVKVPKERQAEGVDEGHRDSRNLSLRTWTPVWDFQPATLFRW